MSKDAAETEAMLPLSAQVYHILLALAAGARHGYAIMQEVEERTDGRVKLGAGTLYGAIKRLRKQGLIEERGGGRGAADARRRTYALTTRGRAVAVAETRRMERLVEAARLKRLARRRA